MLSTQYRLTPLFEKGRIDFKVTWSNVKVKLLVFEKLVSKQYFFNPLLENHQIRYSGFPLGVDVQYVCSSQMVQDQCPTVGLTPK